MKHLRLIILLFLFVQISCAQMTEGNFKKKLSFKDTFFGNEEDYQVCYPKEHRTFFYMVFLTSGVAISMFAFFLYTKSKHNKVLKLLNHEMAEKNTEILDSIRYAKRIQESILPSEESMKQLPGALSVIYKPRDIVSGDFYWVYKKENTLFLAVVDCTGHGVPGAFLSLLAHNAIEQAVIEKGLGSPRMILDSMNSFVKSALKQSNSNEVSDGMEVGLCVINGTQVNYAGANIKLKFYHKHQLHEIKATKCSVGTVQSNIVEPPVEHTITLEKGDRIYMHSDGIVDQFGGPQLKKFSSKKLNELIADTSKDMLEKQSQAINDAISKWKGNAEQTDDVLLLMYQI